jgi:hypothetical protein
VRSAGGAVRDKAAGATGGAQQQGEELTMSAADAAEHVMGQARDAAADAHASVRGAKHHAKSEL